MKKIAIMLSLLGMFACEDKKDDPFTIIGKWQYSEKLKSNGDWRIIENGGITEFTEAGIYKAGESEYTYIFDESKMTLKIILSSTQTRELKVVPESNNVMIHEYYDGGTLERAKYKRV